MENPWFSVKYQGEEIAVPRPHGQGLEFVDGLPAQAALAVFGKGDTAETADEKDKSQPVLSILAEVGPVDGAPQGHLRTFNARLFTDLPPHAAGHIFMGMHLSPQSVVFAQMLVIVSGIAVDKQGLCSVRGKNKTQGG